MYKLKRKIAFVLLIISIVITLPANIIQAYNSQIIQTSDGFRFDKSTGTLIGYRGGLRDITIPDEIAGIIVRIVKIEDDLDTVTIGPYVEKMGNHGMKNIYASMDNPYFTSVSGVLYNKDVTEIVAYPSCRSEDEYTIAPSTRKIGDESFRYTNLKKVNIPEAVTEIGSNVFRMCQKMEEIIIPESVEIIGGFAFYGSKNLKSCILPKGLKSLGQSAFFETGIKEITIPDGVKEIGEATFYWCPNLEKINLGKELESIGENAFYYCQKLEYIKFGDNLKEIGYDAFRMSGLKKIEINSVEKIGRYAFTYLNNLESIVLGENIKDIDIGAFAYNENLRSIKIGANTTISRGMFRHNFILEEVEIAEGITEIGQDAFAACSSLKEIIIPNSVKTIGTGAFSSCNNLRKVILPENISTIGNRSFSYTSSLKSIYLPANISFIGVDVFKESSENVTVMCYENSYAHEYSIENNINYSVIDGNSNGYIIKVLDKQTNAPLENITLNYPMGKVTTDKDGIATLNLSTNMLSLSVNQEGYGTYNKVEKLVSNAINIVYLRPSNHLADNIKYEEITPSHDIVEGPQIDILGESFNFFNFTVGLDFSVFKNIQFDNDVKAKKFKILVGFKDLSKDKFMQAYNNVTNLYNAQKNERPDSVIRKYYKNLENDVVESNGEFGVKADLVSIGFIEFNYSSGDMVLSNGGISITGKAGVSSKYPFAGVCYATFGLDGELGTSIKLVKNKGSNLVGINLDEVSLGLRPKIAIGAGLASLAYAEAGIWGGITGKIKNLNSSATIKNNFEAALDAKIYLELQALGFKTNQSLKYNTKIYPKLEKDDSINIVPDTFSIIERDYLNGSKFNIDDIDESYSFIKNNVYTNSEPQLVDLDNGDKLLLWIDDNTNRTLENKSMLMYSIYSNNEWSEPRAIDDDGTSDFSPRIYKEGNKVHIVWQSLSKQLDVNATLEEATKNTELKYVVFENGIFTNITDLTSNNEIYEGMHSISGQSGELSVYWIENSNNNIFMLNGINRICKRTFKDNIWSEKLIIKEDVGRISALESGYSNGEGFVSYIADSDKDTITMDDSELFVVKGNTTSRITQNSTIETSLQVMNGNVYWVENNYLKVLKDCNKDSISVLKNVSGDSKMKIIEENNNLYVFENVTDGFKSEIYFCRYDKNLNEWFEDIKITNLDKNIKDFFPSIDSDNNVSISLNTRDIKENYEEGEMPFYNDSLLVMNSIDKVDLQVDKEINHNEDSLFSYDYGLVDLSTNIRNNGTKHIDKVKITLMSGKQQLSTEERELSLNPGESKELIYSYRLGAIKYRHDISLKVEPIDKVDINEENNYSFGIIGQANLSISSLYLKKENNTRKIILSLYNHGIENAESVVASFYLGGIDGTKIKEVVINNLDAGASTNIEVVVPEEQLEFSKRNLMELVTVEVSTSTDERHYYDNRRDLYIEPLDIKSMNLDRDTVEMRVGDLNQIQAIIESDTNHNKNVSWVSSDNEIATVDENGNITAKKAGEVKISVVSQFCDYIKTCKVTVYDMEDINMDKKVDMLDIGLISINYNLSKGQDGYKAEYDLNDDGILDIYDLVIVSKAM